MVLKALKKLADDLVEGAEKRTVSPMSPTEDITELGSGNLAIRARPEEELKNLNKLIEKDLGKGINLGRIGELFDDADDFSLETMLTNLKTQNKELFEEARRGSMTMEQILAASEKVGHDKIIFDFMNRKPGQAVTPEETIAGLITAVKLQTEIAYGVRAARKLKGEEKRQAFKKLRLMTSINVNLTAQVGGGVSEAARSMAVVANIGQMEGFDVARYAEEGNRYLDDVLDLEGMSDEMIDFHLNTFATLQSPTARARYAEKGFIAKSYDVAMEIYINSLLSSPVTHMVNIAGNAVFQIQTLAERGLAGLIGEIRTLGGKSGILPTRMDFDRDAIDDRVYLGEAAAEAHGLAMAQKDAFVLMSKALYRGEGSDPLTKIDIKERRAIGSTDDVGEILSNLAQGDVFTSFVDVMGVANRLPGRFLGAEDEYFKAITQRRVLYREAHIRSQIAYKNARRAGLSRDKAKRKAEVAYVKIMQDPPKTVTELMVKEARDLTFTQKPNGFLASAGGFLNQTKIGKILVPFYNTPTNIVTAVFDRSLNVYPIYKALRGRASGREFDMALAKLSTGWGIAYGAVLLANGDYGDNIVVNGRITRDPKTKRVVVDSANVPPYSIGFKQDDGNYKYYTFSRFDPLSAILAQSADYIEFSRQQERLGEVRPEYGQAMEFITQHMVLGIAEYAGQLPMLQGVSELVRAAGPGYDGTQNIIQRLTKEAGRQVGSFSSNVVGGANRMTFGVSDFIIDYGEEAFNAEFPIVGSTAFTATMERFYDPAVRSTAPDPNVDIIDAGPFMQGFYKSMQQAKARNIETSLDLPKQVNYWGEEVVAGDGSITGLFNPVRIQSGNFNSLDQELLYFAEAGFGSLQRHPRKIDGIELNNIQMDDYNFYFNNSDEDGRMPGDLFYDESTTILSRLNEEMISDEYLEETSPEFQFDLLNDIVSEHRGYAKKRLISSDDDLSLLLAKD